MSFHHTQPDHNTTSSILIYIHFVYITWYLRHQQSIFSWDRVVLISLENAAECDWGLWPRVKLVRECSAGVVDNAEHCGLPSSAQVRTHHGACYMRTRTAFACPRDHCRSLRRWVDTMSGVHHHFSFFSSPEVASLSSSELFSVDATVINLHETNRDQHSPSILR